MEFYIFLQISIGVVLVGMLVVTARDPKIQISLFCGFLPFLYFYLPPRALNIFDIVDLALLLIILSNYLRYRKRVVLPGQQGDARRVGWTLTFWIVAWGILGFFGIDRTTTGLTLVNLGSIFLVLAAFTVVGPEGRDPQRIARGFVIALGISVMVVFYQLLIDVETGMYLTLNQNVNQYGRLFEIRYPGPFRDAQPFGQFLAVLILFTVMGRDRFKFDGRLVVGLLGFFCLLINGTRIALVGLILGSVVAGYVTKRLKLTFLVPAFVLLFGALILSVFIDVENILIVQRIFEIEESFAFRFGIWVRSWGIFEAYPLTGIGLDNFANVILDYDPNAQWASAEGRTTFNHPESTYLKILIETGVIGVLVFALLVGLSLRRYIKVIKAYTRGEHNRMFFVAGFASYIALLISFLTVYTLGDPRIYFLFGFLTLLPYLYPLHLPQQGSA